MLITERPLSNLSKQNSYGLNIPTLMPDEYLSGYFGRVAILSKYESITDLHMFMARITHQRIARETPILMCLSKLLEIDPIELWENHTVYPIKLKDCNSESIREKLRTSHHSTRNINEKCGKVPTFFCIACVESDIKMLGYTYWKRRHQTLESEFCKTHPEHRLLAAIGNERLYFSPVWHIKNEAYNVN